MGRGHLSGRNKPTRAELWRVVLSVALISVCEHGSRDDGPGEPVSV